MEKKCYGSTGVIVMALYLMSHWLLFAIDYIHFGALRTGISSIVVDARIMSPRDWQTHLRRFGVDSWLLFPPVDGGCDWDFAVRTTQRDYARYLVAEANEGREPKAWGRKRAPRSMLG
jgi:hypothetical protein